MLHVLKKKIGNTATIVEDYGGYEITVIDSNLFPWNDIFSLLLDSGFQVWISKNESCIKIMSKPEID